MLSALLLLASASHSVFAQDQPQPSGKFYGPLGTNSWTFKPPVNPHVNPQKFFLKAAPTPAGAVLKCAVPLLEMNIPSGTNFVIGTITALKDLAAPGREAKNVLPPCSQR